VDELRTLEWDMEIPKWKNKEINVNEKCNKG
jgi:hypothetical protein